MHAFNYCTFVAACQLTSRARGIASKISQSHGMKCCAKTASDQAALLSSFSSNNESAGSIWICMPCLKMS